MKEINKILVITLSNVGDVILTTPVIKILKENFPHSSLSVMCSERVSELFDSDPIIDKVIIYNKFITLKEKIKLVLKLRKKKYDIVLDLRHTLFPLFLGAKYNNSVFKIRENSNIHKRDFHLNDLNELNLNLNIDKKLPYLYISDNIRKKVKGILEKNMLEENDYIVVSPGGGSGAKLWPKENFLKLCNLIKKNYGYKILLVGDKEDKKITKWIYEKINPEAKIIDMAGKTTLLPLAGIVKNSKLLITNDSGVLHIGSAVRTPIIAIFGPTNEQNYGPLGDKTKVIKKDFNCRPCIYASCGNYQPCLSYIDPSTVYKEVQEFFNSEKV